MDAENHTVTWPIKDSVAFEIKYDGRYFKIVKVNGHVYINNEDATVDTTLPESCVITVGEPQLKWDRVFVTFDLSHPEVVL